MWSCYPHLMGLACTVEIYTHASKSLYLSLRHNMQLLVHAQIFIASRPIGQIICLARYIFSSNSLWFGSSFLSTHNKSSKPLSLNLCINFNSDSMRSACNLLTRQPGYNGVYPSFLGISSFFNCLALRNQPSTYVTQQLRKAIHYQKTGYPQGLAISLRGEIEPPRIYHYLGVI